MPWVARNQMSESVRGNAVSTIAIAGVVAGAIDLALNTVKAVAAGTSVLRPWQGVAAALLGKDAVAQGGDAMGVVGLGLHFLITISAAAIYYLVAKRHRWLVRHAFLAGLVFGTIFFLAINYVILPLSLIGHPLYVGGGIADALLLHIIMIGLPISMIIGWRLTNA